MHQHGGLETKQTSKERESEVMWMVAATGDHGKPVNPLFTPLCGICRGHKVLQDQKEIR